MALDDFDGRAGKNQQANPMNITHKWKRFVAIGCSHGHLIDPWARDAILSFCERWKPVTRFHLGDAYDLTAFRAGAGGGPDSGKDLNPDLQDGTAFLEHYRPTTLMCGNHERRLWAYCDHPNALISCLAGKLRQSLFEVCRKMKTDLVEYRGLWEWRMLGDYKLGHGYIYNENACRDHAEAHGNCIFAHTHRAGMMAGRRDDEPLGLCVGTLADIPNVDYANQRRATLGWRQGFVWGEYTDKVLQPFLFIKPKEARTWRLPL